MTCWWDQHVIDETCMSNLTLPGTWWCTMEAPFAHDGAVIRIPPSASCFGPSAFPVTFGFFNISCFSCWQCLRRSSTESIRHFVPWLNICQQFAVATVLRITSVRKVNVNRGCHGEKRPACDAGFVPHDESWRRNLLKAIVAFISFELRPMIKVNTGKVVGC